MTTTLNQTTMKAADKLRLLRYVDYYVKHSPHAVTTMCCPDIATMAILNCPRLGQYTIGTLETEIVTILRRWDDIVITGSRAHTYYEQDWTLDELQALESVLKSHSDRSLTDQAAILCDKLTQLGFTRTRAACQHKIKRSM